MKEEFNLSEKRKELLKSITEEFAHYKYANKSGTAEGYAELVLGFVEEQDKEFIKRLKAPKNIKRNFAPKTYIITEEELNKLAGDKLK